MSVRVPAAWRRNMRAEHQVGPAESQGPTGGIRVDIDASAAPQTLSWLEQVQRLCVTWYPQVVALLHSPGFVPPPTLSLRSQPTLSGGPRRVGTPAITSGTVITVGADWIGLHPDDTGLVLHELVHVVQSYPSGEPWWVTEGIADWVRYQRFERSDPRTRPDVRGHSYRDGYAVTAAFLAWIEATHHVAIVAALNTAMRHGAWSPDVFSVSAGAGVDELWARFLASGA